MSTEEYIRQAQIYLNRGKLTEAIDCCKRAIELQPFSPSAYTTLGEILEAQGDPTAARDAFVQALEISPQFFLAHAYLGQLYSDYSWLDEAVFHYRQALDLKPDWAEVHYNLGNIFHKQGNLLGAIDCYRNAIAKKPDYLDAFYNLAVVLDENSQLEAAMDTYRQVIALKPDYVEAYSNLGVILLKDDRAAEAIEVYQRAMEIKPDWATLHNNLGQALLDKSPERAIASYLTAIELEPDMVLAHYNLGKAWQLQGEHSAAVACFDRAIEINSDYISGYTDAGFSLMVLGKIAEAMPYFERAIALKPDFVEAYCRLGDSRRVAAVEDDELSRAIAACDRFLTALTGRNREDTTPILTGIHGLIIEHESDVERTGKKSEGRHDTDFDTDTPINSPQQGRGKQEKLSMPNAPCPMPNAQLPIAEICDNLAEIYLHLGNALTEYGGHESAAAYYQKALQIQPQNAEIYWRLGNSLAQEKRFSAAIAVYRMALTIQPALPQVYFELAKLLEKQGRWERAIDYYQKVLDLQVHGYGEQKQWKKESFISPAHNSLKPPHGIYLSSWDWLVNANLDADNYVELFWKSPQKASAENIPNSQFAIANSKLANSECAGLTCGLCLQRLSKWFDPVHLGWGVCRLSNSQPIPVAQPKTFVAAIPNGRVWSVPQENYWLICKAIAVITPDNYLLADVSRDYPGFLPGCEKHDVRKHSVFKLESFPSLKQIDGRVAVLSGLSGNVYFHWMVDVLPRIELLRHSGRDLAEIDWFLVNSCQHQFQRESLRILGIPEEKVLESDRLPHIQATELIVPSFAGYLGWPSGWGMDFLRREFLKGILPSSSYPKRIYISRSKARYRRVLNEEDVVEVLEKFGFVSILPESLSLAEQIAHFYHAEVIVAAHGSGLTNTIFCSQGTKVIELVSPHYISHYYWGISQYLQLEHYFLTGEAFECYPIRQLMYQNSLTEDILVNLSSLKKMVEVVGLG
ncbi:tetratricopeptide repeat protein [Microcoleus vaginatus PCC 9802]|uniref:tetratricopeptide repeat protein n=1 Tax=Microcoleus vaginatus TaxID=119532 RepID=UPI00020D1F50|nr:Tetratricopeptide TPR_1 repeat-containing protein [Microcoleus vaginatus FGP-2]UNU21255.1 tetratricopeptide repeat protein [Microcoleus vaginatus PCC 9802]